MESAYHLPDGTDELEDGILSVDGGVAWSEGQAYAWSPSKTWMSLPAPPSSIEDGFRTSEGILVGTESDELGFWGFGDGGWSWWQDESECPFSEAHPPIGGRLIAEDQRGFNDLRLLVYRVTPDGLEQHTTVHDLPELPEGLEFAFVHVPPEDPSTSTTEPHLVLLSGETLRWRPLSGEDGSFRTDHLSLEEEVRWFVDGFPPSIGEFLSGLPPQVCGNTLFLHRGSFDPETTIAVGLDDGAVSATGLVPLGRSRAPWQSYADGRPGETETLLDAIDALPPPPEDYLADAAGLIDVTVQDGTLQAALTDCGIYVAEGESPRPAGGIQSDAPLSWRLWLGKEGAERDLYRKVASELDGEEMGVEALQVHVGPDACGRFLEELRGDDPPRSIGDDFSYNGDPIRALFGPYGPDVADLVEAGLADDHAPVRVAACMAAGAKDARDGNDFSNLSILDREPVPDSRLWPNREALPREALWENLSHETLEVRAAAAETCGLLRLAGSGDSLQPLLHDTPLLDFDTESVRETALEALRLIPEIPDATTEDLEDCIRSDPSPSIRQTAVETLCPHCRGASSLEALIWSLGDTATTVADNMSDALIGQATALTPEQYHEFIDRWLLRYLGHRRDTERLTFEISFPEQLPGKILGQRLISGDVRELRPMMSADQLTLEDLNTTEETLQMAPAALSIAAVQAALFEEIPLASSPDESSPAHDSIAEFEGALEEHLAEKTFLDEIDDSTFNYQAPAMQAAELTAAIYEHDSRLGRRLAALVVSELGLPSEETGGDAGGYRPLHARLRDFSGESPHEKCHRYVQELAEANGAGRLLALYVLAVGGDADAEATLVEDFTAGGGNDVPMARPLLQHTAPFSRRGDAFVEETLLGPYISSDDVPLARRWEASQDLHPGFKSLPVEAEHISSEQWVTFFEECVAADDLLSWDDRHGTALHLAWLDGQRRRPAELWVERTDSITEVPDDEQPGYVRDQLWAGSNDLWAAFWEHWPDWYGHWALRMLADQGDAEAASRIEAVLEDETVPQQLATETIQAIRGRENP